MGSVVRLDTARAARTAGAARSSGERWVRIARVAEEFSVSVRTVERWLARGLRDDGQAVRRPSKRLLLFRLSEVDRWLVEQGLHPGGG